MILRPSAICFPTLTFTRSTVPGEMAKNALLPTTNPGGIDSTRMIVPGLAWNHSPSESSPKRVIGTPP
jgi:hypothetical protein